jgi:RNA polymerase sigma-70 factor (ECF subfamily)
VVDRPLDEDELIERTKRGDADSYEALVHAYQGIALRTAYVITGSASDAEEAVQDGFVKAFRAIGRFRRGAPFRPWLLRIVANEARNRRRSAGRRAHLALRVAQAEGSGGAVPSPENIVLSAHRNAELVAAVNRLSDEHRLVIVCRYFLDLSEEETAVVAGVKLGTVKSRVSRALESLRAGVEDDRG